MGNVNPNSVNLRNVATVGKGSSAVRKIVVIVHAVDAPGATCDPGELSDPTYVNLHMVDDDGDGVFNDGKTIVCEGGRASSNVRLDVFVQGPKSCLDSAVPDGRSTGAITATATGSVGTAPYVEDIDVRCAE